MKKVKVGKSKIHGNGLFADESIKRGDVIELVHTMKEIEPGVVKTTPTLLGRNYNHSDDANALNVIDGSNRYLVALKEIEAGGEITTNYKNNPDLEQPESFSSNDNYVSFDYDDTLTTPEGFKLAQQMNKEGKNLYVITARDEVTPQMIERAEAAGIPKENIITAGSDEAKVKIVKENNISKHIDNKESVIKALGDTGELFSPDNYPDLKAEFIEMDLSDDDLNKLKEGGFIIEEYADGGFVQLDRAPGNKFKKDTSGKWVYDSGAPVTDTMILQELNYGKGKPVGSPVVQSAPKYDAKVPLSNAERKQKISDLRMSPQISDQQEADRLFEVQREQDIYNPDISDQLIRPPKNMSDLKAAQWKINSTLGFPMEKARLTAVAAAGPKDDPVDNFRHPNAGRYVAEAISDYTGNIPYISPALGFIGSNVLGVGHELSTLFSGIDERPMLDQLKESGEDIYNNYVGAKVGASDMTPEEKTNYLLYLSYNNKLPDGVVGSKNKKGQVNNMYFKKSADDPGQYKSDYKDGGDLGKPDPLTTFYSVKGSDGVYRKVKGKWEVDWNRSGNFQPLSKGNVSKRTALLNSQAQPLYDQVYDDLYTTSQSAYTSKSKPTASKKSSTTDKKAQDAFEKSFKVLTGPESMTIDPYEYPAGTNAAESWESQKEQLQPAYDNVNDWYTNWYIGRAQLPEFQDIAMQRLHAINPMVTVQTQNNFEKDHPGSVFAATYKPETSEQNKSKKNQIFIANAMYPDMGANDYYNYMQGNSQNALNYFKNEYAHEKSHWYENNFPQEGTQLYSYSNEVPSTSQLFTKGKPTSQYLTIDKSPEVSVWTNDRFKGVPEEQYEYLQRPTELRARLNVWRMQNNIDPTKKYTTDEIRKIMDENIKNFGDSHNNIRELYKLINNDPNALKVLNDRYVSTDYNKEVNTAAKGGEPKKKKRKTDDYGRYRSEDGNVRTPLTSEMQAVMPSDEWGQYIQEVPEIYTTRTKEEQALRNYNDWLESVNRLNPLRPTQSDAIQPADWFWQLGMVGPAGLEAAGSLLAKQIPKTGITYGTALNTAAGIHGATQVPQRIQDWQDVAEGKKDWREATAESLITGLELYGGLSELKALKGVPKELPGSPNSSLELGRASRTIYPEPITNSVGLKQFGQTTYSGPVSVNRSFEGDIYSIKNVRNPEGIPEEQIPYLLDRQELMRRYPRDFMGKNEQIGYDLRYGYKKPEYPSEIPAHFNTQEDILARILGKPLPSRVKPKIYYDIDGNAISEEEAIRILNTREYAYGGFANKSKLSRFIK